jgi:hypothetical protein
MNNTEAVCHRNRLLHGISFSSAEKVPDQLPIDPTCLRKTLFLWLFGEKWEAMHNSSCDLHPLGHSRFEQHNIHRYFAEETTESTAEQSPPSSNPAGDTYCDYCSLKDKHKQIHPLSILMHGVCSAQQVSLLSHKRARLAIEPKASGTASFALTSWHSMRQCRFMLTAASINSSRLTHLLPPQVDSFHRLPFSVQ